MKNEIDEFFKELLNDNYQRIVEQLKQLGFTIDFSQLEDKEVVDFLKAHCFNGTVIRSANKKTYVLLDDKTDYHTTDELHKKLWDKINSLEGNNFLFFTSPEAIAEFVYEDAKNDNVAYSEPDKYNPEGYWYNRLTGQRVESKGNH